MDDRTAWFALALVLCAGGVITFIVLRRRPGSAARSPAPAPVAAQAVARTHFTAGAGYVEIGGVVLWATASPDLPILPGHVLRYELNEDGGTVTVSFPAQPTSEELSA